MTKRMWLGLCAACLWASTASAKAPSCSVVLTYDVDVAHRYDLRSTPAQAVERTAKAMRERLEHLGVSAEVEVARTQLSACVRLGSEPRDRIEHLLARAAHLEFRIVDDGAKAMVALAKKARTAPIEGLSVQLDQWSGEHGAHEDPYLTAASEEALRAAVRTLAPKLPRDRELLLQKEWRGDPPSARTFYVERQAGLSNDDIASAEARDGDVSPIVSMELTPDGARRFEALSERAIGRKLAIILDGNVMSAPVVQEKIKGGHAQITLGLAQGHAQAISDAKDLAAVLITGSYGAPVKALVQR